jgi:hypothetical protein
MKTYSTLDELFADAGTHQVTAQELLNGRTYVCGEWQAITDWKTETDDEVIGMYSVIA